MLINKIVLGKAAYIYTEVPQYHSMFFIVDSGYCFVPVIPVSLKGFRTLQFWRANERNILIKKKNEEALISAGLGAEVLGLIIERQQVCERQPSSCSTPFLTFNFTMER